MSVTSCHAQVVYGSTDSWIWVLETPESPTPAPSKLLPAVSLSVAMPMSQRLNNPSSKQAWRSAQKAEAQAKFGGGTFFWKNFYILYEIFFY